MMKSVLYCSAFNSSNRLSALVVVFGTVAFEIVTPQQLFAQTGRFESDDTYVYKDTLLDYPVTFDREDYHRLVERPLPDGRYRAYYKVDSTVAFTGQYKRGKPDGVFQHYFRNGQIRHTQVYRDGIEHGPFTYWHENGSISMSGYKLNGLNHGDWYDWWSNGNLRRFEHYEADRNTGVWRYYGPNGRLDCEGYYSKGFHVGEWRYYHKNGVLKERRYHVDSLGARERDLISFYDSTMASLYFPVGIWKEWDENGNLVFETYFDDNFEIEKIIKYYQSGIKESVTMYNGFTQGFCSRNPSRYYRNGDEQTWFENGTLRSRGVYANDAKHGEWVYWTSTGTVEKIEVYVEGVLVESK